MIGTTVTHYRILEKLGAGGMGEVYLADDTKLHRKVAIKILPEELTRDPERKRRFIQEARAAAGIEHPHIAAVYDIDEVNGRTFMAMEYVRGQSLREAISVRRLTPTQAVELAIQVADGLAKVHERGVVHRDLKPENVIVSEEGYAKIIDFGLAKLLEPLFSTAIQSSEMITETRIHTTAGQILGTVAYMSPEQAQGLEVDARSDIFSFGVMLYEMLSGHDPFKRPSAVETLSAILRDTPPPLVLPAAQAPADLQRILRKALAKAPTERYQRMRDLAEDLRALREKMARRAGERVGWWVAAPALVLAAALLAGTYWLARRWPPRPPSPREPVSVLVADFDNRTGDPIFDGAVEQALGLGLEGSSYISTYGRPQARTAAGQVDPGAGKLDERLAQLVCRSLGIKMAVAGSIEPKGDGYALKAWAIDPVTSKRVGEASRTVKTKAEVLKAADGLAADLRRQLSDAPSAPGRGLDGDTFTTASLDAMNSYARGQELQYLGKYDEAMAEYRKAIAQDPEMGRAYSSLATMFGNQGEREEAAKYYDLALARLDRMTDREKYRTRGAYFLTVKRDYEKAIDEYGALVKQYPADTAGLANLALAHFYAGDMQKALEQGRKAVEIYPRNVPQRNNVALYAMYAGDFATAESEARAVLEMNSRFEKAYVALALSQLGRGDGAAAAATYAKLQSVSARGASYAAMGLADLALYEGRAGDAVPILEKGIAGDEANKNASGAAQKRVALAEARLRRRENPAALSAADAAAAGSKQEGVLYLAARAYVEGGQEAKALRLASDLAARLPESPQAYAKLIEAESRLKRGKTREAISLIQEAQKHADTWLGRYELGRAYLDAGAFTEAHSEFDACFKRKGEATAAFLDDVPSLRFLPPVYYYIGRAQEGLKSPKAADSFKTFLTMKEKGDGTDPLVADARRRLQAR